MCIGKNVIKFFVILAAVCIMPPVPSVSAPTENGTAETSDYISKQVDQMFAKADELAVLQKLRSRQYLNSLGDDELARIYVRYNTSQAPQKFLSNVSLKSLKKDRASVIEKMVKTGGVLNKEQRVAFRGRYAELADELAALGLQAVPAVAIRMGYDYRRTGHWALAKKALLKMGPDVVEPLIPLMDSDDKSLRTNAADLLGQLANPRAKDVYLRCVDDKNPSVRECALKALVKLGPDAIGSNKLATILIKHLEDHYDRALQTAISGLRLYGDESVIDALQVIEEFHLGRNKGGIRSTAYEARQAINAILRRAGKPVKEVQQEDYLDKKNPTYEELCAVAQCPNAAIRRAAISRLGRHEDDRTALFLLKRMSQEKNPEVFKQIARTLRSLMIPPKGSSEPVISPKVMQKALDNFISVAETDPPQDLKVKIAAIHGVRGTLFTASLLRVPLRNIFRFKRVVRVGLSSKIPDLRIACYSAVTSIANISPETVGESWSPQEREELQQQLAPLLDLPSPDIRLIECLEYIGDKRLTPRLIELLEHSEVFVRLFAANSLGRIGDTRALPALKYLADTDPHQYENGEYGVREAARRAIKRIKFINNPESIEPVDRLAIITNQKLD
jgi:HEAT repeat protein